MKNFTLGTRTPFFKYIKVYDMSDDMRKLKATDVTYRNPPCDLPKRPKYQVALDVDMGLDAPDSHFIISVKLNGKM